MGCKETKVEHDYAQQQRVATEVANLLGNVSTTFATIAYTTQVKTAAAHKERDVRKQVVANVQLFNNIDAFTDVYARAVRRSAATHTTNDRDAVDNFTAQSNYFNHTDCYSIVQRKAGEELYLYCIMRRARSRYTIDGAPASKGDVAALLTPSAARTLLQPDNTVQLNAAHGITHSVVVRTIALHNIQQVRAMRRSVDF